MELRGQDALCGCFKRLYNNRHQRQQRALSEICNSPYMALTHRRHCFSVQVRGLPSHAGNLNASVRSPLARAVPQLRKMMSLNSFAITQNVDSNGAVSLLTTT